MEIVGDPDYPFVDPVIGSLEIFPQGFLGRGKSQLFDRSQVDQIPLSFVISNTALKRPSGYNLDVKLGYEIIIHGDNLDEGGALKIFWPRRQIISGICPVSRNRRGHSGPRDRRILEKIIFDRLVIPSQMRHVAFDTKNELLLQVKSQCPPLHELELFKNEKSANDKKYGNGKLPDDQDLLG